LWVYQLFKKNTMAQIRNEIYDETGLVRVEFIEVDDENIEDLISQKEADLISTYKELEALKERNLLL
jgi:hypothetical protein